MGVRALLSAGLALLVSSAVVLTAPGVVSERNPAETTPGVGSSQQTTRDGVYTKAQADRVTELYGKVCANCHDPAKVPEGKKPAPPLLGDVFLETWKDRPLGELLTVIRVTMPNDGSAVLTPDDVVDLTAYILQANKFPEGKTPLANDDAGKKIVIVKGS